MGQGDPGHWHQGGVAGHVNSITFRSARRRLVHRTVFFRSATGLGQKPPPTCMISGGCTCFDSGPAVRRVGSPLASRPAARPSSGLQHAIDRCPPDLESLRNLGRPEALRLHCAHPRPVYRSRPALVDAGRLGLREADARGAGSSRTPRTRRACRALGASA